MYKKKAISIITPKKTVLKFIQKNENDDEFALNLGMVVLSELKRIKVYEDWIGNRVESVTFYIIGDNDEGIQHTNDY